MDGNCLNRVRRKTIIRHQTAAQLLAEFVALLNEKKILYLPNDSIKLALKHPNADTRLPEIAAELLPEITIDQDEHHFLNNEHFKFDFALCL